MSAIPGRHLELSKSKSTGVSTSLPSAFASVCRKLKMADDEKLDLEAAREKFKVHVLYILHFF